MKHLIIKESRKPFLVILSYFAVSIIWGSTYLSVKVIVDIVPPFLSMGLRFIGAAFILVLYLLITKNLILIRKEIVNASTLGVLYFAGGVGSVAWAVQYIPSGIASLLTGLIPLWFLVFDIILNKRKRPGLIVWFGIASGLGGIIILVGLKDLNHIGSIPLLPALTIIFGTIIWSFTAVFSTKLAKPKNGILSLCIQMLAGGVANIILSFFLEDIINFNMKMINYYSIISMLYLIIFGSVVVLLAFNFLIENVNPGLASTYSYMNQIIALFLGWIILKEEINTQIIVACCLILLGVALIKIGNKASSRQLKLNGFTRKTISTRSKLSFNI